MFIFEAVLLKRGSHGHAKKYTTSPSLEENSLTIPNINKDLPTQRRFRPKYIENTFKAIQSTFRALEKHSRRPCKIFICSGILGELQSFGNFR